MAPFRFRRSRGSVAALLVITVFSIILVFAMILSVALGAADIGLGEVLEAVFHYDNQLTRHLIIQELRIPRAVTAALVGAALAVSGALMQGLTRNPLASPEIMGLSAGSAFALAILFSFYPGMSYQALVLWSFAGAALGASLTYGTSVLSGSGMPPERLALAGTAVGALLSSLSAGISIYFMTSQDIVFWYAGGLAGSSWAIVRAMLPWLLLGFAASILVAKSVTVLGLGTDTAAGLGLNTTIVKTGCMVIVVILAGAAVSAAGPIGFVGLIIPHIVRYFVGVDYRWILPCSAVMGASFLVLSDIAARMAQAPNETPVGAVTAVIGIPFFLYLVRRRRFSGGRG